MIPLSYSVYTYVMSVVCPIVIFWVYWKFIGDFRDIR